MAEAARRLAHLEEQHLRWKVHGCFKMGWLDSFKGMDDNMTKHVKLFACESNTFCTTHIFV